MTQLLLIIFLLLSSGPAYAEWASIGGNVVFTVYVDTETVRRKENLVKMWALYDFKTLTTSGDNSFLSKKVNSEFDCTEERMRLLALTHYSDNMGNGNVVFRFSGEDKWEPVVPVSAGQSLWKIACGKK